MRKLYLFILLLFSFVFVSCDDYVNVNLNTEIAFGDKLVLT